MRGPRSFSAGVKRVRIILTKKSFYFCSVIDFGTHLFIDDTLGTLNAVQMFSDRRCSRISHEYIAGR
jgi:hypothetical protein